MGIEELGRGFDFGLHWIFGRLEQPKGTEELTFWVAGPDEVAVLAVYGQPSYAKKCPEVYAASSRNYDTYELNEMPKLCRNLAATPPNYTYTSHDGWGDRNYASYRCSLCGGTDSVDFDSPTPADAQVHTHPRWDTAEPPLHTDPDFCTWKAARRHRQVQKFEETLRELWVPLRDPALRTLRLKDYGVVRLPGVPGNWLHPDEAEAFLESYDRAALPETYSIVEDGLALARKIRAGVHLVECTGAWPGGSTWDLQRLESLAAQEQENKSPAMPLPSPPPPQTPPTRNERKRARRERNGL